MSAIAEAPSGAEPQGGARVSSATRKHLRGSSILFAGRILSLAVNFATQVLIVRYLSKADFGIFAYGLSIVMLGKAFTVLGLDMAVARFLPIYDERGEREKVLGSMVVALGTVIGMGLAVVALVAGFHGLLGGSVASEGTGVTVLLILILLSPLQAADDVLVGAFAVFSRPRAIFFRKYVLAPGLRLAAILLVLAIHGDVRALAVGYVVGGAIGVVAYTVMLGATLRADGFLAGVRLRALKLPFRELFAFALPLVAIDLLAIVTNTSNIIMLGHFGTAHDVADYRVVLPAAQLNMVLLSSFGLLFTPLAARLFARGDSEEIQELYWRTAVWMAVLSFPVFAVTTASSHALTVLLFGGRYADSASILALLSLGYYFSAMLGFNGLTLRVFGMVRYSVVIAVLAGIFNVAINLILIPRYGALGAGIGTCATFLLNNVLKQAGLRRGTGIRALDRTHARVYVVILAATVVLAALAFGLHPGAVVSFGSVALVSLVVLRLTRSSLRMGDMFPEVLRVPVLRRLVS